MSPKYPPPAPNALDQANIAPEISAGFWNTLTFNWMSPLMALGAQRPLEEGDLPKLRPDREPSQMARDLATMLERRRDEAEEYNQQLERGEIVASRWIRFKWSIGLGGHGSVYEKEALWRITLGKKGASLFWTLSELFGRDFYIGGICKASYL